MSAAVGVAPGVLRRRFTVKLMQQRMLERWEAFVLLADGRLVPVPVPSCKLQRMNEIHWGSK